MTTIKTPAFEAIMYFEGFQLIVEFSTKLTPTLFALVKKQEGVIAARTEKRFRIYVDIDPRYNPEWVKNQIKEKIAAQA